MLQVVDKVEACKLTPWPGTAKRNPEICEYLVLHRIDNRDTPEALAEFFTDLDLKTGGRMPYHFFIDGAGTVFQCVPLGIIAPAAVKLNRAGIQIALLGDFQKKPPTAAQAMAVTELVAELLLWKPTLKVMGHTDSPGASLDPKKVCPGKYLVPGVVKLGAIGTLDQRRKERWSTVGLVA